MQYKITLSLELKFSIHDLQGKYLCWPIPGQVPLLADYFEGQKLSVMYQRTI